MQTSKFLGLLLVLHLSLLTACNLPAPQARDNGKSADATNFIVGEVKGESPFENLGSEFSVPKSRTFSFTVCLKDSARSKELIGHSFRIEEIKKELKTDPKGCLNWSEEVAFNFFSEPTYLQWDRKITATGVFRGSRVAHFAINPWNMLDRSAAVLNLETTTAPNLIKDIEEVQKTLTQPLVPQKGGSWFTIAPLEFKFIRVAKETTADKEVIFNTRACIKSGAITKNLRNFNFKVRGFQKDGRSKIVELHPDNAGCLNWDDQISFKYYECQKYFKSTIEIDNQELAIKQSIGVAINPWESWGTSFARDLRYVAQETNIVTDCKKENILPSNLLITGFNYTTLSYGYDIDNSLNLIFKKKIRFKADAKVVTFSDMAKGRMEGAQKIRPGVYLLKVALVKNQDYYNQKIYVTSAEQLISTLDGDIRTDLELITPDLKGIGNRNTLLIELNPVSEDKVTVDENGNVTVKTPVKNLDEVIDRTNGLQSAPYSGAMTLSLDRDSQELSPVDQKSLHDYLVKAELPTETKPTSLIREYIEMGARLKAERLVSLKKQSDLQEFAKNHSLQIAKVSDPQSTSTLSSLLMGPAIKQTAEEVKSQLKRFATTGLADPQLEQGMCAFWFKHLLYNDIEKFQRESALFTSAISTCMAEARAGKSGFIKEKRVFVQQVGSQQFLKGYNQSLTVGSGITLTNLHSSTFSKTKAIYISAGISQKFAEFFSVGITANYNISHQISDATGNTNTATINTNSQMTIQENVFRLRFDRYEECGVIKLNPRYFLKGRFAEILNRRLSPADKAEVISRGLMICTGEINNTPILRNEHYYLLSQDSATTQMQDNADARNRNFVIALRGRNELRRLLYFMKSDMKTEEAKSENVQHTEAENLDRLLRTGLPSIPGSFYDSPETQ